METVTFAPKGVSGSLERLNPSLEQLLEVVDLDLRDGVWRVRRQDTQLSTSVYEKLVVLPNGTVVGDGARQHGVLWQDKAIFMGNDYAVSDGTTTSVVTLPQAPSIVSAIAEQASVPLPYFQHMAGYHTVNTVRNTPVPGFQPDLTKGQTGWTVVSGTWTWENGNGLRATAGPTATVSTVLRPHTLLSASEYIRVAVGWMHSGTWATFDNAAAYVRVQLNAYDSSGTLLGTVLDRTYSDVWRDMKPVLVGVGVAWHESATQTPKLPAGTASVAIIVTTNLQNFILRWGQFHPIASDRETSSSDGSLWMYYLAPISRYPYAPAEVWFRYETDANWSTATRVSVPFISFFVDGKFTTNVPITLGLVTANGSCVELEPIEVDGTRVTWRVDGVERSAIRYVFFKYVTEKPFWTVALKGVSVSDANGLGGGVVALETHGDLETDFVTYFATERRQFGGIDIESAPSSEVTVYTAPSRRCKVKVQRHSSSTDPAIIRLYRLVGDQRVLVAEGTTTAGIVEFGDSGSGELGDAYVPAGILPSPVSAAVVWQNRLVVAVGSDLYISAQGQPLYFTAVAFAPQDGWKMPLPSRVVALSTDGVELHVYSSQGLLRVVGTNPFSWATMFASSMVPVHEQSVRGALIATQDAVWAEDRRLFVASWKTSRVVVAERNGVIAVADGTDFWLTVPTGGWVRYRLPSAANDVVHSGSAWVVATGAGLYSIATGAEPVASGGYLVTGKIPFAPPQRAKWLHAWGEGDISGQVVTPYGATGFSMKLPDRLEIPLPAGALARELQIKLEVRALSQVNMFSISGPEDAGLRAK